MNLALTCGVCGVAAGQPALELAGMPVCSAEHLFAAETWCGDCPNLLTCTHAGDNWIRPAALGAIAFPVRPALTGANE